MLNIANLKTGQIRSIVHEKDVELVQFRNGAGGREYPPSSLTSARITRRAVFKGNVAGRDSYANKMRELEGEDWEAKRKPWFKFTDKPGVVVHKSQPKQYLALLNPAITKREYFVDGVLATDAQLAEIEKWKKGSSSDFGVLATFGLDSVEYYNGAE
jgi:hypothetical protein